MTLKIIEIAYIFIKIILCSSKWVMSQACVNIAGTDVNSTIHNSKMFLLRSCTICISCNHCNVSHRKKYIYIYIYIFLCGTNFTMIAIYIEREKKKYWATASFYRCSVAPFGLEMQLFRRNAIIG